MKVKKKVKSPVRSPNGNKRNQDVPQLIFDETQAVNLLEDTQSEQNLKKKMSIDIKQKLITEISIDEEITNLMDNKL